MTLSAHVRLLAKPSPVYRRLIFKFSHDRPNFTVTNRFIGRGGSFFGFSGNDYRHVWRLVVTRRTCSPCELRTSYLSTRDSRHRAESFFRSYNIIAEKNIDVQGRHVTSVFLDLERGDSFFPYLNLPVTVPTLLLSDHPMEVRCSVGSLEGKD